MRVLEVEQSRPLLLPDLPLLLLQLLQQLLVLVLLVVVVVRAGGLGCRQALLKPHLPQEHVQGEGPHHEARIEREPGSEGLHYSWTTSPFSSCLSVLSGLARQVL